MSKSIDEDEIPTLVVPEGALAITGKTDIFGPRVLRVTQWAESHHCACHSGGEPLARIVVARTHPDNSLVTAEAVSPVWLGLLARWVAMDPDEEVALPAGAPRVSIHGVTTAAGAGKLESTIDLTHGTEVGRGRTAVPAAVLDAITAWVSSLDA